MSGISGLSALLTISLVALVTMQVVKGQMDTFENYGDLKPSDTHGLYDFSTGNTFTVPTSADSPQSKMTYIDAANIAAATPSNQQLWSAGAITTNIAGPFEYMTQASQIPDTSQQNELYLCSTNQNTLAARGLATSLLPSPNIPNREDTPSNCAANELGLGNQVFLSANAQIGTAVFSSQNPNLQIRSEPPNPQVQVSPWMQSSISPDLQRRPLEVNSPNVGMYSTGIYGAAHPHPIRTGPNQ